MPLKPWRFRNIVSNSSHIETLASNDYGNSVFETWTAHKPHIVVNDNEDSSVLKRHFYAVKGCSFVFMTTNEMTLRLSLQCTSKLRRSKLENFCKLWYTRNSERAEKFNCVPRRGNCGYVTQHSSTWGKNCKVQPKCTRMCTGKIDV